jgi:hypothetical protein
MHFSKPSVSLLWSFKVLWALVYKHFGPSGTEKEQPKLDRLIRCENSRDTA